VNEEREEIKILLDGGAEVNCISLSFAIIMELQTYQWEGKITNASSKVINHHGYTYFKIKVGKEEKMMPFIVIDSIGEYELLLGTPGLEQTKMIIDYGRGEARSDERAYLLIADKPESHYEDRYFRVIARENGVVPKRSMKKFPTKIENQKEYEEAIRRRKNKEESFQFIPAKVLSQTTLRLPEGIVEASGEEVQDVVISNVADTEVNIKKGALIGYVRIPKENHAIRKIVSINYDEENKISEDLEEETYIPEVDAEDEVTQEEIKKRINEKLSIEESRMMMEMLEKMKLFTTAKFAKKLQVKTECSVPLKENAIPLRFTPYRCRPEVARKLKQLIDDMLASGKIERAKSAWAFPVVLVDKPDGSIRFCVNYSKLTDLVILDTYPLPRIDDTLDKLSRAKYFTTVDAKEGFHQIPMKESDKEILAFTTPFGNYVWKKMPYGYCNAPSIFQRAMNETIDESLLFCALVYVDDVLIFSNTFDEHVADVKKVLEELQERGWELKLSKCCFGYQEIDILGYTVSHDQVKPMMKNVDRLRSMKRPNNIKELQALLGVSNYYRRFIQGYNYIVEDLFKLLRKNEPWRWEEEQENAMKKLLEKLSTYPVLKIADFEKPFILKTDASDFAYGAVLAQEVEGLEHPIAFYAGSFSTEQRSAYETWKKEGWSVIKAVKYFSHYLKTLPFRLITDHQALKEILKESGGEKNLDHPIYVRWRLLLSTFKFTIIHRPGKYLVIEDAISRSKNLMSIFRDTIIAEGRRIDIDTFKSNQRADPLLKQIIEAIESKKPFPKKLDELLGSALYFMVVYEDGLYFTNPNERSKNRRSYRLVLCESDERIVFQYKHRRPLEGHHAHLRTYEKIMKNFWFPNAFNKVKEYYLECEICDRERNFKIQDSTLIPIVAERPFEIIQVDHIGPLPESEGKKYIMSVIDLFSKKKWYIPTRGVTAKETFIKLYQYVFSPFWIPKMLLTDQHGAFNAELSEMICELLGVDQDFALPQLDYADNRHSQTMGAVERSNRTIEEMLRKYVDQVNQEDWTTYVFALAHAENKAYSSAHGMQPDSLIFGTETDLDLMNEMKERIKKNPKVLADEVSMKVNKAVNVANKVLEEYRDRMKATHEKKFAREKEVPYQIGESIWLKSPDSAVTAGLSKSLASKSLGPFRITTVDFDRNNVTIQITGDTAQIVKMKYIRRALPSQLPNQIFKLVPNQLTEEIVISSPQIPENAEKGEMMPSNELKKLSTKSFVGKRIEVRWGKEWYKATIVGYTKNLLQNLIYYDIRTVPKNEVTIDPTSDFYKINLFKDSSQWRLLSFK
jgi:hypothetical protein